MRSPAVRLAALLAVATLGVVSACASSEAADSNGATEPDTTVVEVTSSNSVTTTQTVTTTATDITSTSTVATAPAEEGVVIRPLQAGAQRIHYEVGPLMVKTGQNNIAVTAPGIPKPEADGFVVRIDPNLRLEDGSIPAVDVIHLHHGVWLNLGARDATTPRAPERFFAAGEEKTITQLPAGYGYPVKGSDVWMLNYMIHNLWPDETQVWVTYDIDVIPADAPEATAIVPARPIWTDVQNGSIYPVFDVHRGSGTDGEYVYPDDQPDAYVGAPAPKNEWTVDRDGVLLGTAGHLHPGGLHTDLWLQRTGANDTAHLFSSEATYYEPAGAVSWDVSMSGTPEDWRVAVHQGDVLSTNATYDSATASWYESMGIMVVWMADAQAPGEPAAPDPFVTKVDVPGELTHGHLPENDHHGGEPDPSYLDLTTLDSGPLTDAIGIADYMYAQGDMLQAKSVPTVARGGAITFENLDAPLGNGLWHTITACKAPCNAATGIAYPLADADIDFDSGQLGVAGPPTSGLLTWATPDDLPAGTYTYFCRIHPFMRGGFRVVEP